MSQVFDDTPCELGEGALWHPTRKALIWFDIKGKALYERRDGKTTKWDLALMSSAAGWVDDRQILVAGETHLSLFDLESGAIDPVAPLEQDNPLTRSNDGRADPWGGFWIGTMSKAEKNGEGSIYRYYRGEVRRLFTDLSIPNAISFSPDGTTGYFTDTRAGIVMRQRLSDTEGWLVGEPEPWLDLRSEGLKPDGAVVDAQGNFWSAQWGAGRVACYDPAGHFQHAVEFGADHTSCPAFGGAHMSTLFCTTALHNLSDDQKAAKPDQGKTFMAEDTATGQTEHRVIL